MNFSIVKYIKSLEFVNTFEGKFYKFHDFYCYFDTDGFFISRYSNRDNNISYFWTEKHIEFKDMIEHNIRIKCLDEPKVINLFYSLERNEKIERFLNN